MGLFDNTKDLDRVVRKAVEDIVSRSLQDANSALAMSGQIVRLREELETLRIEKARKDEEHAKREREVEHKVGLERKRQEFEMEQAKREATVSVREENLKADRTRFEEQLKFHETRFTAEVGYLKDMITEVMKRLPSAEIVANIGGERGRQRVG